MPREPRVRLDRDRVRPRRIGAVEDLRRQALAVALGRQLPDELADEQPTVREDEHALRARRLDEPGRGDRLSRGSRDGGTGSGERRLDPRRRALCGSSSASPRSPLSSGRPLRSPFSSSVSWHRLVESVRLFELPLVRRDERGEHSGESVDLMPAQLRTGREARRLAREHALEPEHEREPRAPFVRRLAPARGHLRERLVERAAACGAGREHLGRILVRPEERLPGPALCERSIGRQARRLCGCRALF